MALPSSYSDSTLAAYMEAVLSSTAGVLGLTADAGDFAEAVNDVTVALGVDAIADATDIPRIRAEARVAAWQLATDTAAGDYNYSNPNGSDQRAQVFDHCVKQLERAKAERAALIASSSAAPYRGPVVVQAVW